MRSAAPTPDTAAPSKLGFGKNLWGRMGEKDSEEDEEEDDKEQGKVDEGDNEDEKEEKGIEARGTPLAGEIEGKGKTKHVHVKKDGEAPPQQESEFSKWFWEHRGETNRAWKKRRREASKEQRQRENRRRGGRSAV